MLSTALPVWVLECRELILDAFFGQVVDIDIPNSLLEEQGRQMYAAKLIELQVQSGF